MFASVGGERLTRNGKKGGRRAVVGCGEGSTETRKKVGFFIQRVQDYYNNITSQHYYYYYYYYFKYYWLIVIPGLITELLISQSLD